MRRCDGLSRSHQMKTSFDCLREQYTSQGREAELRALEDSTVVYTDDAFGNYTALVKPVTTSGGDFLPAYRGYERSEESVKRAHVAAARELGLGLQLEFQPLLQGGVVGTVSYGYHSGYSDWRYCAIACVRNPHCRAWTFKYPLTRLVPPVKILGGRYQLESFDTDNLTIPIMPLLTGAEAHVPSSDQEFSDQEFIDQEFIDQESSDQEFIDQESSGPSTNSPSFGGRRWMGGRLRSIRLEGDYDPGYLGGCYMKTALVSPIHVDDEKSLAISGGRRLVGNKDNVSRAFSDYFGVYYREMLDQLGYGVKPTLELSLEATGCLRPGTLYVSRNYDAGSIIKRTIANVTFDQCVEACRDDGECEGVQHSEIAIPGFAYMSKVIEGDVVEIVRSDSCYTFSTVSPTPDNSWPFVLSVVRLPVCANLGVIDPIAATSTTSLMQKWGYPFASNGRMHGVTIRGKLKKGKGNIIVNCPTVRDCEAQCEDEDCEGYSYNTRTKVCALASEILDFRRDSVVYMVTGLKNKTVPDMDSILGSFTNVIPRSQGESRLYATCTTASLNALQTVDFQYANTTTLYQTQDCLDLCCNQDNCVQWFYDPNKFMCYVFTEEHSTKVVLHDSGHFITALAFCDLSGDPSKPCCALL
ncbi:PAN domain protein [Gregarina niphandrodes]|uniref:PAN domain protein n=1 Tax=Gregarina niphandrodes TaxID=110365 RepID=A0A023B381_GRENI|nr:PAN domain protein [Gregarina niphandrodes]EZG55133.1 PAN domain protein [Gregarina niphandrodes]|eukprot:XP_011131763.1 PAN domain protein [Gregarina niphandrodes]